MHPELAGGEVVCWSYFAGPPPNTARSGRRSAPPLMLNVRLYRPVEEWRGCMKLVRP